MKRYEASEQCFRIALGQKILEIRPTELLTSFWVGGLDSACMVCGDAFDDSRGPCIRTVSYEDTGMIGMHHRLSAVCLIEESKNHWGTPALFRVHNRHLACIVKTNTKYYPVSHVWHPEVAAAHVSRERNIAAEALLLHTLVKTVPAIAQEFGPTSDEYCAGNVAPIEVWHDYISAPQWRDDQLQKILLILPEIYRHGMTTVIHLNDVSNRDRLKLPYSSGQTPSDNDLKNISKFLKAQWFERMWVSLEYAYSTRTCLMLSDFAICLRLRVGRVRDSDSSEEDLGLSDEKDRFGELVQIWMNHIREGITDRSTDQITLNRLWEDELQLPPPSVFELEPGHISSLGRAIYVIAQKECRFYRDRFVALCGFLRMGRHEDTVQQIPANQTEACLWLWRKCLERGDYTPLFLQPSGEKEVEGASWLVGHEKMSGETWALGETISPASDPTIIRDGRIQIVMECVGILTIIENVSFKTLPIYDTLRQVLEFILNSRLDWKSGLMNAELFVEAVGRIYGAPSWVDKEDVPTTVEDFNKISRLIIVALEELLDALIPQFMVGSDTLDEDDVYKISQMLRLHSPVPDRRYPGLARDRMSYAAYVPGNTLGKVLCMSCGKDFVFRLELHEKMDAPPRDCKVYRIPGLQFDEAMENGVGLVVSGTRIIGKMIYGTRACRCRFLQSVLIC